MKEYTPDESIDVLVERIRSVDIPEHDRDLLLSFKDWLVDRKPEQEAACILYAWYQMVQSADFAIDTATEKQVRDLLDQAPTHSESLYQEAVDLFYDAFLEEKEPQEE